MDSAHNFAYACGGSECVCACVVHAYVGTVVGASVSVRVYVHAYVGTVVGASVSVRVYVHANVGTCASCKCIHVDGRVAGCVLACMYGFRV